MSRLIRKEFLTTAWVHLAAVAMGLGLIPVCLMEPHNAVFMALFTYLMYSHLVHNQSRYAAANRPDNLLLNSLPVTRGQVVGAKYLYVLLCAVGYAAFLSLILLVLSAFGVLIPLGIFHLWLLLAAMGVLYHLLLMPLSYVDARYGTWVNMAILLAILLLPQAMGQRGKGGQAIAALLARLARLGQMLGGWAGPILLVLAVAALGWLSLRVSQGVYRRAEF